MGNKEEHRKRTAELEELRSAIEDVGSSLTLDESELVRAVHDGQMAENVHWANAPYFERKDAPRPSPAGYLPKQKPLMYRLDYHEMAKRRAEVELDKQELERVPRQLQEYFELIGRMKECDDWLRVQDEHGDWGTLVVGKEGREAKMPTFGSRTEVDLHIKNRHLGMGFTEEEEVKAERKKVYRQLSEAHSDAVDRDNAESKRET